MTDRVRITEAGQAVIRTRIIGTTLDIYSAWEEEAGHTTVTYTTIPTGHAGRIGTRPLPAEIDALPPMSEERSAAVRAWHAAQYEEAYAAIIEAYPEAAAPNARRTMGEIEIWT